MIDPRVAKRAISAERVSRDTEVPCVLSALRSLLAEAAINHAR